MFSNTANNSASDNVNTRPRLKAYFDFIRKMRLDQHKLALIAGYVLTAALFFGLGLYLDRDTPPEIAIEEPVIDLSNLNITPNQQISQPSEPSGQVAGSTDPGDPNCTGKIKGNIGSSGKIYHMPGGAFYDRTVPELCFDTEAEAQSAGFRKSSR